MILLWLILDQKKWEKECKARGTEPAMNMKERLEVYFFFILLPIIAGIIIGIVR